MKKIIVLLVLLNMSDLFCQEGFKILKLKGDVYKRKAFQEDLIKCAPNDTLGFLDLIDIRSSSYLELSRGEKGYKLNGPLAITVGYLVDKSKNELAIFLAESSISNKTQNRINNSDEKLKSTSVYGSSKRAENSNAAIDTAFAERKLNGALFLYRQNNFNSALIYAFETYKLHPFLKKKIDVYLTFIDKLEELGFYEEALSEYLEAKNYASGDDVLKKIEAKIRKIKDKL